VGQSDQSGQHPANAVLGNQSAARKRSTELRLIGSKTHVAIERNDQSESDRRAVQRGNDWLPDRGKVRISSLKIGARSFARRSAKPISLQALHIYLAARELPEVLYIGSGTKRPAGPR